MIYMQNDICVLQKVSYLFDICKVDVESNKNQIKKEFFYNAVALDFIELDSILPHRILILQNDIF